MVTALKASSGSIFIRIQASDTISGMFPLGALPGLKSEAIANGADPEVIKGMQVECSLVTTVL